MTDDPVLAEVGRLLAPILERIGAELYDLERSGGTLRVTVDRSGGIDLDALATVNRELGRALDESDPIPSAYTLEVSSPGLERTLRTAAHWERSIGDRVKVKLRPRDDAPRRAEGVVAGVAGGVVTLTGDDGSTVTFGVDAVERARTVFEWGPAPKPGGGKGGKKAKAKSAGGAVDGRSHTVDAPLDKGQDEQADAAGTRGSAPHDREVNR